MPPKTEVPPDDRRRIYPIIERTNQRLREASDRDRARVEVMELARLRNLGEMWADRAILALAVDGQCRLRSGYMKSEQLRIQLASGDWVRVPVYYSRRRRKRDGGLTKVFSSQRWLDMPWDELLALIDDLRAHSSVVRNKADGMAEVAQLRFKFPDCETGREACKAAGIDPRKFFFRKVV